MSRSGQGHAARRPAVPIRMLTFDSMPLWLPPTQRNRQAPPPGPSPWYLSSPSAQIHAADGVWTWINDPKLGGVCHLFSPRDQAVLTVDFYCYVQQLPGDRLLIWHEEGRQTPSAAENPKVVFDLLVLTALVPVQDAEVAAAELKANRQRLRYQGGHPVRYELVTSIDAGIHAIGPPPEFGELPETLVLADFGPSEVSSNYADRMYRAIFAFDFSAGQLEVIPQDWFNGGGYDYGYQWITRVDREPATGRIVGEAIRLGRFRLDPSGRQIDKWLHSDPFYRPVYE